MTLKALRLFLLFYIFSSIAYGQYGQFGHWQHYRSYNSYDAKGKKGLQKMYISFHLPIMALNLNENYNISRPVLPYTGPSVDTTIHFNKVSSGSFGLAGGISFNLGKMKEFSSIALDIGWGFDFYRWSIGKVKFSPIDSANDVPWIIHINVPVAVMYRSGGEVALDPHHKLLFGIGAGIDPTFSGSSYLNQGTTFFKIRTFLMTEIGIHAGIAWKFRVSYYPSSILYFNSTGSDLPNSTGNGNLTVTGSNSANFVLALILLPYSWHWGDDNGY